MARPKSPEQQRLETSACPQCGAPVGETCRYGNGRKINAWELWHRPRRTLAEGTTLTPADILRAFGASPKPRRSVPAPRHG